MLDAVTSVPEAQPVPPQIQVKIKRGRAWMLKHATQRRLCMKFEKGETYWFLNEKQQLLSQDTVTRVNGGGKPAHRIRNRYNEIRPIVEERISAATQRVPSYDVSPSTTDPGDVSGARLAEKVAVYGYDQWRLRQATLKVVKLAIAGGGAGYMMPYFDPNVGPFSRIQSEDGERFVGQGDVRLKVMSGNECYGEPGVSWEDSRWFVIEQARPLDEVMARPGYLGGKLTPDASVSDVPTDKPTDNMVMVTDYFERPSAKNPDGLMLCIAGGKVIAQPDKYPLSDSRGVVLDEPCIHRLVYTHDPTTDQDLGLVWQLIDYQRTIQDCQNKLLEWKNRTLNPQMIAPEGSLVSRPDDVPGSVKYYRPVGGAKPEWETPPPVPQALFQILEETRQAMRDVAGFKDINAGSNVAASTVSQVNEFATARWQSFMGDLAEFHSRVMRHCLLLVARYYTEPRLLAIKGRFGPELVSDFRGSQLEGQAHVTVLPGSLEYKTRGQITQQVLAFADRQWVSPQQAMAAINGGTAEKLIESYELDVARANRIIQKIRDGSVMELPEQMVVDPMTGGQVMVPGFMPNEVDNTEVWKAVFGDWMKTQEYEQLDSAGQEVARLVWGGLVGQQQKRQQDEALQQAAQAQALGSQNAAKPTAAQVMPDQAKIQ